MRARGWTPDMERVFAVKRRTVFDHFFRASCTAGLLCPFDHSLLVCDCRLCHTSGVEKLLPLGDQAAKTFAKFWYGRVWTCFCHRALKWLVVSVGGGPPIGSGCRQPRHLKVSPERYRHQLMPRLHLFGMTLTHLEVAAYWIKNLAWLHGKQARTFSANISCKYDQQQQIQIELSLLPYHASMIRAAADTDRLYCAKVAAPLTTSCFT